MSNDRGIRWGIMGTGNMAGRMVSCIRAMDGEVIAVASRANKSARAFASQHGIEMAFAGYEALAAEADVDVVYIATTNDQHYRNALSCIGHGKAVLCEKPLTVHLRETVALIDAARENDTLLVEAMWMRFQPFVPVLEDLIREQRIGPVRFLNAHFAFPASDDANGRWFNRELGGGSLLDIGVYPLTLANLVLGAANVSHAVATLAPTGVDAQCSISSVHAGGAMSMLIMYRPSPTQANRR